MREAQYPVDSMSTRIKRAVRLSVVVGIVVFVGMQLVPIKGIGSNPTERFQMAAPPEVEAIMRRACFDCHTNETRWPFWARIAPGSWLMARDVTKGRKHLNFSEWASTDDEERTLDLQNCWDQIDSGAMPPWFYVYPLHLHARLSPADKDTLKAWLLKDKDKKK